MKKIFVLKGNSDTGKTTKINTIAEWIINKYNIPNTINLDVTDLKKDTYGILTINNLRIGINSAGDNFDLVRKIDSLAPTCDIIIASCRTKGITYQHLKKNYNWANNWLDKYIDVHEYQATQTNQIAARDLQIIDVLQSWLTGLEK